MAGFVPPDQKGMGWGILSSVEGIGIMVGPVAGGWLADLFSEGVTVTVSATLLAGIAVVYLLIPRKKLLDE